MCGRYTLSSPKNRIVSRFGIRERSEHESQSLLFRERYNIAPTQQLAAVLVVQGTRRLDLFRWGLIPSWAKDPQISARMINARSETAATKPAYRVAMKRQRCLLPADGFYEWQKLGTRLKQPFLIRMADESVFAFAGLWERWQDEDGTAIQSCTILTTTPNAMMAKIHNRMPVILDTSDYDRWLDPAIDDVAEVTPLLRPYPADQMFAVPVSRHVNSPHNDDPRCIEPVTGL